MVAAVPEPTDPVAPLNVGCVVAVDPLKVGAVPPVEPLIAGAVDPDAPVSAPLASDSVALLTL